MREPEMECLAPLHSGDRVRVRTWVEDFRRVRSRRAYELPRVGDEQLVARGVTDWVYVNSQTGQPARIPPEMVAAFIPEGPPPAAPGRHFPPGPPPPPGRFAMRRKVMWQEIDMAGHVNNAQYLAY